MNTTGKESFHCEGPEGMLPIAAEDKVARKLAMLFEGKCLGLGPSKAAQKYGYSKQRYFQVLHAFLEGGSAALVAKKTGPKRNYVRTETVVSQVIRHRFLDPEANAAVIAQKMRQTGVRVSQRSVERIIAEHGLQKKLYKFRPKEQEQRIETHYTKERTKTVSVDCVSIERAVCEMLSEKISGTHVGLWFLVPEHVGLGTWDLLTAWSGVTDANAIEPRLALQMVHESALCVNGVRQRRTLRQKGFETLHGLPFVATDEVIHGLLDGHTVAEGESLQLGLGKLRQARGHYPGHFVLIDPHRINTCTTRHVQRKKANTSVAARKVVQTFFAIDGQSGQPLSFGMGSSSVTVTQATLPLVERLGEILPSTALLIGDTEHFTVEIVRHLSQHQQFSILVPMPRGEKVLRDMTTMTFTPLWAGYAVAEGRYQLSGQDEALRLIVQRTGETQDTYDYKPFVTTSHISAVDLMTRVFPERWNIEEFFNLEDALGWNRASTLNLNIRFGKLSLALIAQAAIYELRRKLPVDMKKWTAESMAHKLFSGIDGDIRVKDDTIVVTCYNAPHAHTFKQEYEHLPGKLEREGIDPRLPWLYNFKVDFRFK